VQQCLCYQVNVDLPFSVDHCSRIAMNSAQTLSLYSHVSRWANENQGVLAILIPVLLFLIGWASGLLKLMSRWVLSIYWKARRQHSDFDFVIRRGSSSGPYWEETATPLMPGMLRRFNPKWSKAFQISHEHFAEDIDPSFDLSIISNLKHDVFIMALQVEIINVAHEIKFYGGPQATRISQQASLEVDFPDIKAFISSQNQGVFPRLLEPVKIGKLIDLNLLDPFHLEPGQVFRCEVLLRHYVERMPNYAVMRFWLFTASAKYSSKNILVFTL
jgi:hypothetical protein